MKDGRKRRGIRYRLEVILVLFILAKLCGENKVYGIAEWVQLRSEYLIDTLDWKLKRNCLPHHSTYRRILTDESMQIPRCLLTGFSESHYDRFLGVVLDRPFDMAADPVQRFNST